MNFFKKALIILFLFPCASLMAQTRVACMLGDTLALNLSGTRGDLQWQVSNDSLNWTDIPGQQSGQLEFISSLPAQWVRAGIRENNCPVFYENPIFIEATDTTLPGVDADIIVMDTVLAQFTPDSAQQEIGIYQYNANTEDVSFKPGDILLGTDGEGYLRFVDNYIIQNGILTIHTHQASLDDLFDDESFSFDLLTDSVESRTSGFNYDFSQTVLYDAGGVTLSIESGTIGMSGDWRGDLEYSLLGGLKNFYFGTNNLNLNTNFDLKLVAASSAELINGTKQLAKFSKTIRVLVAGLPVMVTLYADLKAKYSVNVNAQVEMGANFTADVGLNSVISYSNGQYSNSFNVDPSSTIDFSNPSGQVKALVNLSLVPEFKIKLYSVVVPYVKPSAHLDITSTVASPSLNWDILGEGYAKLEYGIEDIVILGKNIASFEPNIFESEHVEYKTPFRVEIVSGNNQVGQPGQFLANPIVLKVKDSFSSTQRNVLVTVTVTLGNGSITQTNARTNAEGLVSINWKLGTQTTQAQQLTISVKNGSMEELSGSPVSVTASFGGCGTTTSITDASGNVYPVVQIGNQCWTKENLRTSKYADGSVIPNVTSAGGWAGLSTGAWCNFSNIATNGNTYGKLYNWGAVADPRNVCPTGWHVPNDAEWTTLTTFLGGESVAGGKMKDTTGWQAPNTSATNESGFSGLPGGYRGFGGGEFGNAGFRGYWWSSSESSTTDAWNRSLSGNNGFAYRGDSRKYFGFSVRCLRD